MNSFEDIWELVGLEIKILLDEGDSRKNKATIGRLITRDPISNSILIAKLDSKHVPQCIEWIPSSSVKTIERLEDFEEKVAVSAVFENYLSKNTAYCIESEDSIKSRGQKIVSYLRSQNLIVVEKQDGMFIIDGTVTFEKPYLSDNFYCDIPLVLKRIQKLVKFIYE